MKAPKQTRQEYRTARQEAIRRNLRAVLSFVAFVLLIAAVSAFYYWRNAEPKIPDETITAESTTPAAESKELGSAVFFVYLQSETEDARAAAIVRVDADAHAAELTVLTRKQVETLAKDGGLSSPSQCGAALQSKLNVAADRSVIVTERAFKDIVNTLGGLEVTVSKQAEFVWDGTKRTLLKGKNLLRGETLLRYLQWSVQQCDTQTAGSILGGLLALGLSERSRAKGESLFTDLINAVRSDISAMDYIQAQPALDRIAAEGIVVSIEK
ncbi:MAG: LCP family protein [Oscillospiraceae bacterium]|jgi:hypothetical protein|nr:LCP family protein [Oscillospiraceae bacterium]